METLRARQTRPIGLGDAPNRHQQKQGIVPPPVQNHNFEIKPGMINLVQNKMFHGLPSEDPMDHLDEFDRLCDMTKLNGVSEDAIKMRLFPMSLSDKAHQWEKSLSHGTITTWDECKKAFLAKFFSTGRTAKLRTEISGFAQRNNETFAESWERFKGYTSQCPHQGFNNESLLSTLYRENIANSNGSYGEEFDRTSLNSIHNSIESVAQLRQDMHALNSKLDKLILAQLSAKNVNPVSGKVLVQDQEGEDNPYAEPANYQRQQHSLPPGFAPISFQAPPTQDWDMKDMLKQLLQGQAKGTLEMNNNLVEIDFKIESLNSRVKTIESSGASTSLTKAYAHAVTLRSGRQLCSRDGIPQIAVNIDDEEGEDLVEFSDILTQSENPRNSKH
ncbi:unnamed protein product [Microthlaspi erraticum]|uniref:Retrotransposon gag domain-containing protein n=1 Tax=Microthlaspi erraticum TaxID=1685480 RepID=A0A6D2K3T5_9BRAS|nr:unnamed protein product [Microthlaspi erraticum]